MVLFIQCVSLCLLFTLVVLIQLLKNDPVKALYNYPPKIQKRVKSLKAYEGRIPTSHNKVSVKLIAACVFIIIGVVLARMAGADGFLDAFFHMFILFMVGNLYDLLVIDWLIFRHVKKFRIPGTEDMVNEYHNYRFHFMAFMRGIVIGLAISVVVGAVYMLIF